MAQASKNGTLEIKIQLSPGSQIPPGDSILNRTPGKPEGCWFVESHHVKITLRLSQQVKYSSIPDGLPILACGGDLADLEHKVEFNNDGGVVLEAKYIRSDTGAYLCVDLSGIRLTAAPAKPQNTRRRSFGCFGKK